MQAHLWPRPRKWQLTRPQAFLLVAVFTDVRGRSQLSTFMKAYREYARGEGVWDHCTLFFPENQLLIFYH